MKKIRDRQRGRASVSAQAFATTYLRKFQVSLCSTTSSGDEFGELMNDTEESEALLALEDGTLFYGRTSGCKRTVCGEIVFNTSMTGYQEICTDPSYANQIVLFTTSHVGNVGVNSEDFESDRPWVQGIIAREVSKTSSNWRSEKSFTAFLNEHRVPWIEGIDTRKLTRHIRKNGTKSACLMAGEINAGAAISLARQHLGSGPVLIPENSCHLDASKPRDSTIANWANIANMAQFAIVESRELSRGPSGTNFRELALASWHLKKDLNKSFFKCQDARPDPTKIVVYDFGVKSNILRTLSHLGCEVIVVPHTTSAAKALALTPDGIVISNGPGDPASIGEGIEEIRRLVFSGVPLLGICLGCQLIALAAGARTKKMKFGHHGANHPVYDIKKEKVYITSQNHNFVVDETSLPPEFEVTHVSLFDGSVQGIRAKNYPVMGFQGHPEGSPGPQDIIELFGGFLATCH